MKSYRKFWLGLLAITASAQVALIALSVAAGGFLEVLADYGSKSAEDPQVWRFLFFPLFSLIALAGLIGLVYFSIRGRAKPAKISLLLAAGILVQSFVVSNVMRFASLEQWDIGAVRVPFFSLAESWDLVFSEYGPFWGLISLELSPIFYGILVLVTLILFPRTKSSGQSFAQCPGCQRENPVESSFCTKCGHKMQDDSKSVD